MSHPEQYEHHIGGRRSRRPTARTSPAPTRRPARSSTRRHAERDRRIPGGGGRARARSTIPRWRDLSQTRRGHLLAGIGDLVAEHADELARMETLDNGKLLREMQAQMAALPEYYHYYAELADKIQGDVINLGPAGTELHDPGAARGRRSDHPWNSPLTLTTSKLAPALCAGSTIVIKPSEYTSATVLRLAELADKPASRPAR